MKKNTKKNIKKRTFNRQEIEGTLNSLKETIVHASWPKFCNGCGAGSDQLEITRHTGPVEDTYDDFCDREIYFFVYCCVCGRTYHVTPETTMCVAHLKDKPV